jgi:pSer/pThr/pTyr-binding forkhead associated (FHA) protein
MHKLIIEDDEGKEVVFPLIRLEISIGRQANNLVCLTQRNVSRSHARLLRRDGRYILEDLSSYLGTRVNGERITSQTPLNAGDRIEIGDYRMAIVPGRPQTTLGVGPVKVGQTTATPSAPGPKEPRSAWETDTDEMDVVRSPPARLVALTSPWIGREFLLDTDSIGIGRTPDNDIILPHKSLLPHHARVLRDGQRYVIVDPQDGKGVRVNGAAYRRVELKSGDILTLGRVRLRFAAAGDYREVLDRKSLRAGGAGRIVIGMAAIGALSAAVVAFRMVDHSRKASSNGALSLPAGKEQHNRATIEELERAFERKDYTGLLKAIGNLDESNVHAARVRTLALAARGTLVSQHLNAAEKQRAAGNCELARKEAEAALALESYNQAAQGLIARCAASARTAAPPPERFGATWRPAAVPPTRARTPAHERAGRGHNAVSLQPGETQPTSVVDIAPLRAASDKPRHRIIDSSDPYAKDRL